MNEDYYHEQNSCYDPNSFGFDQFQPPQYTVNHPIFNAQNEFLNSQNKLMEQMTSMCDMVGQFIQKKEEEKRIEEEQAAKDRYWKIPVCYDDDDDEESSIPLKDIIIAGLPPCVAITPVLFTKEPVDSLIMEDEHLDTIPETESDELIKSSVEDLVQIPSESEDSSEGECDLPPYDDSSKNHDLTFSNPLFDIDEDFTSSDESFSEEDVPNENFKIFSNPLFDLDEEITSTKVDQIDDEVLENTNSIPPGIEYLCFNAESDLLESLLHRDTSINDSQKIDSLLDEFAGELTLLKSIPPGIDDDNLDPEGEIHLVERLLYDNSSPRPPEEFNSENPTESFSPSPIPVEDSDSLMEEIDIFLDGDRYSSDSFFEKFGILSLIRNNFLYLIRVLLAMKRMRRDVAGDVGQRVIEEVDTFLVPEDSIPPGIESNFNPGGGEIDFSQNVEDDDSITFVIRTFLPFLTYPADSPLLLSTGSGKKHL
ncbi:hypothetical protein Tco_0355145 [Tanacetum coccineum]